MKTLHYHGATQALFREKSNVCKLSDVSYFREGISYSKKWSLEARKLKIVIAQRKTMQARKQKRIPEDS